MVNAAMTTLTVGRATALSKPCSRAAERFSDSGTPEWFIVEILYRTPSGTDMRIRETAHRGGSPVWSVVADMQAGDIDSVSAVRHDQECREVSVPLQLTGRTWMGLARLSPDGVELEGALGPWTGAHDQARVLVLLGRHP